MQPLGCEAETSLRELFGFFKRCLQEGQWELASASVPQLVNSAGELSGELRDIIKAIVSHPYLLTWESVGSPHKLAWFWLQVLEKWTKEQVSPSVKRELEFLLLLEELGEDVPQTALKELHQAFLDTQSERKGPGVSGTTNGVVESCLRALLEKKRPRLAQALAHFLQGHPAGPGEPALLHTFIQYLIERVERPGRDEKTAEWAEEVCAVLSVMPWSGEGGGGRPEALCEALWAAARDRSPLTEERILSSLLRPQCHGLVSLYCATTLRLHRDHLLRSAPSTKVDLPEAEKLVLSLCCHGDPPSMWKTIYFECLSSGKHFLEQVLVTALDLIRHEEFSLLADLLKVEFQPLARLLLLLGWTQCRSLSAARTLLRVLHREQAPASDSVLQESAGLLSSQLGVLEWCKNNNPGISTEALLTQLHSLDSHSALYILHSLTPLAQFEECRVLDLLRQPPTPLGTEHREGISTQPPRAPSPAVQRNVVLFQGFCAMKYALYAFCVNAHKHSSCSQCEAEQQRQASGTEGDQRQTTASAESGHPLFQHYLSQCQLYLEAVPALFRLELLENIFSLLFLSTDDFAQKAETRSGNVEVRAEAEQEWMEARQKQQEEEEEKKKEEEEEEKEEDPASLSPAPHWSHLDLGHFTQGCRGFLVDVTAMEGFLKLLKEGLEGLSMVGQREGLEEGQQEGQQGGQQGGQQEGQGEALEGGQQEGQQEGQGEALEGGQQEGQQGGQQEGHGEALEGGLEEGQQGGQPEGQGEALEEGQQEGQGEALEEGQQGGLKEGQQEGQQGGQGEALEEGQQEGQQGGQGEALEEGQQEGQQGGQGEALEEGQQEGQEEALEEALEEGQQEGQQGGLEEGQQEGQQGGQGEAQQEGQQGGQGEALAAEAEVAESLGCSVTAETFAARLQRLSKRTAEAQWRLQIINTNQGSATGAERPLRTPTLSRPALMLRRSSSSASLRRRKRAGRHALERRASLERHNEEGSPSTSDGGCGSGAGRAEREACPCGGPHSWLVPAMLAPPESLLMSCIRRGSFMEAHQVSLVFGLESSACCGELVFMERYKEVLVELGRVEQKIETQSMSSSSSSSEGLGPAGGLGSGRTRLGSGLSTLQAIGSAAAAGMAFYSISDVGDMLLSSPGRPVPSLEEGYWLSFGVDDPSGVVSALLEELSPAAMAAFDLACCHCQLWKTSRQLLDTAERRLHSSLEARGLRVDTKLPHAGGICGFPMILQQISKILNHSASNKGPVKTDSGGEEHAAAAPFGCCVQEVLLSCHPTLREESIAARLSLEHRLDLTLNTLASATDTAEGQTGSGLLAALVEQAGLKQVELDSHPVRSNMKQLLRFLDQLYPFEPDGGAARPDYMRSFLDYVNTLASVLVRCLGSEDQGSKVKLGNPLLVLLQTPSQLLSHLLFERHVSPDRVLSLLQQEGVRLSVQQVIVQRCCEPLPVWTSCPGPGGGAGGGGGAGRGEEGGGVFAAASVALLLRQHAQEHLPTLGIAAPPSDPGSDSDASGEDTSTTPPASLSSCPSSPSSSSSAPPSSSSFLLTSSALSFLKSRSPLLATLACLSACRGEAAGRTHQSGWSGYFRSGRKEALDAEQISREADGLLRGFPVLRAHLRAMAEPVLGAPESTGSEEGRGGGGGLGAALCGKPLVGLLLSGPQGPGAQAVAAEAFQQALSTGHLGRALSLLELYGQGCSQEGALRDRLLACAALEDGDGGVEQLFRVQDPCLRARVALRVLERWPLTACLELLEFCLDDPSLEAALRTDLELRKKELDIYRWMLSLRPALPWAAWQELRAESKRSPESMLSLMLEAREFVLCAQWVQLYPVSEQLRLQLQTEHLLHLLEKEQTEEAFQLLDGLSDFPTGLEVCERALDRRPGLGACHFLADYLTLHFQNQVSSNRRRHIHALHLGSRVLLTLPTASRQDYFPLLSDPLLMLEQLLMNLKVEWVDVAVRTLRSLLVGQEAGFGAEDIDKLLSSYACKALDFPYHPREKSRSDSVISLQDSFLSCPALDSCPSSPTRVESPTASTGSTPIHTPSSGSTERSSVGRRPRASCQFQPPENPPGRKDWVPDTQQHVCMVCLRERFSMFNRRHHCRRCGRLVCHACSERKMAVEGCPDQEVRVCDQCYAYFHPDCDDELEQAEAAGSPLAAEELHLPEVFERRIQLSTKPAETQQLRSEFYYEQAPSASLCVAILSLHSDQTSCGHQLIGHCRSLSRKLTHPEVDPRLLTDVMRQLLFSAKLMFVKVGRNQDLALCDSYISKVDVLKILVAANYKYIPSLDDILENAAVTRLRNQLLEAEHYQLAVEVSTKSGLDPAGVWQAWGMALLKAGNLTGAREKFARCLKAPVDLNQLNLGPHLLQEIVQHLESTVRPTLTMSFSEDILASLLELEEALSDPGPAEWPEAPAQNSSLHQECLYYLHSYGPHLALVSFHMRHDCMREALQYLLSKECLEEVFLEGVLQPSLETGRLSTLQGLLESLDPGLEACSRFLIASCQLLQRRGHFHTLYQLQQFMMDHVRAAMTCIRFFTHGANSYLQLGEQQRWLVRAKEHLRTYLQEQGRSAGRKRSSVSSFRKKMSSSDVSRHMNTIELQLEVTRFLHRCESSASSRPAQASPPPSRDAQTSPPASSASGFAAPPTLFGGSPMKIDVACKVMLGGKNIEEGFGIAYRVVQVFQLEAQKVYERAGQRLVRQRQYGAVRQLLKCVGESGTATKNDCDALVLSCVSIADKGPADAKELESLILETKGTENKIKAYLQCCKLRPAYLLAVKLESRRARPLVQEVLGAAEGAHDSVMLNICRQWLSEHQERSAQQQQQRQGRPGAQ